MRVFIDSGRFLAVMDRDDPLHRAARDISARLESIRAQLYTSNFIVDETCTLVRARTSHSLREEILADYPDLEPDDIRACLAHIKKVAQSHSGVCHDDH